MPSPIITCANAVTTAVQALFSQARRGYLPDVKREELATGTPIVIVMPKSEVTRPLSRHATQLDLVIDVGYIAPLMVGTVDTFDQAEIDGHMDAVESIKSLLKLNKVGTYQWIGHSNVPIYDRDKLETARQFFSVISLTYRTTVAP